MASPATVLELEIPVEERIARLESDVAHMRTDLSEIKSDVRDLRHRVNDLALNAERSFGELRTHVEKSFGELRADRWKDRLWWLVIAGALLGVMAHGFKWL
jgi:hypothetical protein